MSAVGARTLPARSTGSTAEAATTTARLPLRWQAFTALAVWGAVIVVSAVWGRLLIAHGQRMFVAAPPLTGHLDAVLNASVLPAICVGLVAVVLAPSVSRDARWRTVVWGAFLLAGLWAVAVALAGDPEGILGPVASRLDYLHDVGRVRSAGPFLSAFVDHIGGFAVHVRSHPPGMLLLLWGLSRAGLGGAPWAAALEIAGGAAAVPAVLVAVREVAGEGAARRAMPFVAVAPAAVWVATSADALFMGVAAWAVALAVLATGRRGAPADGLAVAGGLLFGAALMLSYGLALMLPVPLAVAVARRRIRPVVLWSLGAVGVLGGAALAGFWWPAGLAASHAQYLAGVAARRPYAYFLLADVAALAVALGPAAAVGLARLRDRRVWVLVGASLAALALADLSGLSKGEVERIWLPWIPWLLIACGVLARHRRGSPWWRRAGRAWLGVQVVAAIVVQVALRSPW